VGVVSDSLGHFLLEVAVLVVSARGWPRVQ
jgi:hypothetical protein